MTSLRSVLVFALASGLWLGCSEAQQEGEALPPIEDGRGPGDVGPGDDPDDPEEPEEPVNPNCNPNNCDGCCNGDLCVEGADLDSCGIGGEVCSACGEYQACSEEQACEIDEWTTWALFAKSGTVSPTTLAGGSWDGDGNLPDPYVEISSAGWSYPYAGYDDGNTITPEWEYAILFNFYSWDILAPLEITVYDSDGNADDFMGSCPLQITQEQMLSGEDIVVNCAVNQVEEDSGWEVTLYVVPMAEYYN